MYSGSDSTESQKQPQWAVNSSAYQNMNADQVDWAALAQQWIIMKEAGPPPVPGEPQKSPQRPALNEGGEAPMEVENDAATSWGAPQDSSNPENWSNNWTSNTNQNWTWGATNSNWSAVPPPPGVKTPLLPTPAVPNATVVFSGTPPEGNSDNAVPFGGYNTGVEANPGYWSTNKEIKPHNKRYSKVNVPIKAPIHHTPQMLQQLQVTEVTPPPSLDATKRKQLPAWIREGLEKMEKDKLKQMEKERDKVVHTEFTEKQKQDDQEKLELLKNTILKRKSRFDSDGERGSDSHSKSDDEGEEKRRRAVSPKSLIVPLTPEEMMLKVRKTMTTILLEVTNKEIAQICKEEYQKCVLRNKRRASAEQGVVPSAPILSAKLGLGVYNDDDDATSSSDTDEPENNPDNTDSDAELKATIKRRVQDFAKTEAAIEEKLLKHIKQENDVSDDGSTAETGERAVVVGYSDDEIKTDEKQVDASDKVYSMALPSDSPPSKPRQTSPPSVKRRSSNNVRSHSRSSSRSSTSSSSYSTAQKYRRSRKNEEDVEQRRYKRSRSRSRSSYRDRNSRSSYYSSSRRRRSRTPERSSRRSSESSSKGRRRYDEDRRRNYDDRRSRSRRR